MIGMSLPVYKARESHLDGDIKIIMLDPGAFCIRLVDGSLRPYGDPEQLDSFEKAMLLFHAAKGDKKEGSP